MATCSVSHSSTMGHQGREEGRHFEADDNLNTERKSFTEMQINVGKFYLSIETTDKQFKSHYNL